MRPSSTPNPDPVEDVEAIDGLLKDAGLARSLRGKAAGAARRVRSERAAPEELSRAAPVPTVAANGIQWLPVPGWERFTWLWHGFSTRKGGESRAYCPDDAPGELNLGFTADDDAEIVARNRQLLTEALTGDQATPLITLRQIHSNILVVSDAQDAARELPWRADGLMTDQPGLLLAVQTDRKSTRLNSSHL